MNERFAPLGVGHARPAVGYFDTYVCGRCMHRPYMLLR